MNGYSGVIFCPAHSFFSMDTGVPHVLRLSLNCSAGTNLQPVFMIPTTSTCISPDCALWLLPECSLVFWWDPRSKTVTWHLTDPNLADGLPGRQMARVLMKSAWEPATFVGRGERGRRESRTRIALFDVLRDHGNGCGHKTSKRESAKMTDGTVWVQVTL